MSNFQTRSLRNNPGRRNLPTINLSETPSSLQVKTLERKNLRNLSLTNNDNNDNNNNNMKTPLAPSSNINNSNILVPTSVQQKRRSIQMVTTSSTNSFPDLTTSLNNLNLNNNNNNDTSYTGQTKPQIITTKITTSSINVNNNGFALNDLKENDLLRLEDLGAGNSGSVLKVIHTASQKTMAKKTIHIENNQDIKRQIARELKIMNECKSKYIIEFYGSFLQEGNVIICMEYMDIGSLDKVLRINGPLPEFIINHVAYSVLNGLKYLYTQHKIIHRDIKPSNVLLNSKGVLKLCDFGVSRELIGSVADTFVGTSTYMSPERISGAKYTIKGDIWSLGLMLVELATGFFPFGDNENIAPAGILDLLQRIVNEPPPNLKKFNEKYSSLNPNIEKKSIYLYPSQDPSYVKIEKIIKKNHKPYYPFSDEFSEFVSLCLIKEENKRPSPTELLKDEFILIYKKNLSSEDSKNLKNDIKDWCKNVKKLKKSKH